MHTPRALMFDQVSAHLVVKAHMGAFAHQDVVDRPQDRAEAVGVAHPPLCAMAQGTIFHRLRIALDDALEQAAAVGQPEIAQEFSCQIMGFHSFRAGDQHPSEGAFWPGMGAQKRKGVGVTALKQGLYGLPRGLHVMSQMSLAYSRMVRSDENQPTLATLLIAAARQAGLSFHRWSTWRCVAA